MLELLRVNVKMDFMFVTFLLVCCPPTPLSPLFVSSTADTWAWDGGAEQETLTLNRKASPNPPNPPPTPPPSFSHAAAYFFVPRRGLPGSCAWFGAEARAECGFSTNECGGVCCELDGILKDVCASASLEGLLGAGLPTPPSHSTPFFVLPAPQAPVCWRSHSHPKALWVPTLLLLRSSAWGGIVLMKLMTRLLTLHLLCLWSKLDKRIRCLLTVSFINCPVCISILSVHIYVNKIKN